MPGPQELFDQKGRRKKRRLLVYFKLQRSGYEFPGSTGQQNDIYYKRFNRQSTLIPNLKFNRSYEKALITNPDFTAGHESAV